MVLKVKKLLLATTAMAFAAPGLVHAQNSGVQPSVGGGTPTAIPPSAPSASPAATEQPTSGPSGGSNTAAPSLGEVVVTARRIRENLKDVPIAITAVTAAQLQKLDIKSTVDLMQYTPGLQYSNFSAGNFNARLALNPVVFRGLSLNNDYGVTAASLVFLDGAPLLGGQVPAGLDIDRIEVLRGPQSVYFGRSTMAGAINYVTKEPGDAPHGDIEVNVGDYGQRTVSASLSGPVTDTLKLGLQGSTDKHDGYYSNNADPGYKFGAQETDAVSGEFEWRPISNLKISGFVQFFRDKDGVQATAQLGSNQDNCNLGGSYNYYCGQLPGYKTLGLYTNVTETPQEGQSLAHPQYINGSFNPGFGLQRRANDSNIRVDYTVPGFFTITSISSYQDDLSAGDQNSVSRAPMAGDVNSNYSYSYNFNTHNFDQEVRLSSVPYANLPLRWTIGGNYISGSFGQEADLAIQPYSAPTAAVSPYQFVDFGFGDNKSRTSGVYAGLYYDPISRLSLSVEARYQWDGLLSVPLGSPNLEHTFKSFSPRFAATYKITTDVSSYVSFANGSRPGGFNTGVIPYEPGGVRFEQYPTALTQLEATTGPIGATYKQETLETYEAGVKGLFLGHRLRVNADGYYGDVSNLQVGVSGFVPSLNESIDSTANAGLVDIWGIEADSDLLVNRILRFSATFAWNHTEVVKYNCTSCVVYTGSNDVKGQSLPDAPEFSGSLGADLTDDIARFPGWKWFVHSDYVYRGTQHIAVFPGSGNTPARNVLNLRLGVDDAHISIEGYIENLTDDRNYTTIGLQTDFSTYGHTAFDGAVPPPRTFGARAGYRF